MDTARVKGYFMNKANLSVFGLYTSIVKKLSAAGQIAPSRCYHGGTVTCPQAWLVPAGMAAFRRAATWAQNDSKYINNAYPDN